MKAPNIKLQAPEKLQKSTPNEVAANRRTRLEPGIWDLLEAWGLGFGAF
jgi:hypothetical protein